MKILPFTAWYPELNKISSPDTFFGTMKKHYTKYHKEGYFKKMPQEALYIYRINTDNTSSIGLLATLPTNSYNGGNILKHEHTLSNKEKKMVHLVLKRKANLKPILLAYPSVSQISTLLEQWIATHSPLFSTDFELERTQHQLWSIEDKSLIKQLQALFQSSVPVTYIADGHHRTSSMSLLQSRQHEISPAMNFDNLMVALFASNQLIISAFSRIIQIQPQFTIPTFIAALQSYCTMKQLRHPQKPRHKHQFVLIAEEQYWMCEWKPTLLQTYSAASTLLDVQILNTKILSQLLAIKDFTTNKRIQYLPDKEGLEGLASALKKNKKTAVGFFLHPISITDMMEVVAQTIMLPPKSTFFEPRLKSGMVVRRLAE